jgi:hypothetical protein
MPAMGEAWALDLLEHLTTQCGQRMPDLWKVRLNPTDAPALTRWLDSGDLVLGDLTRDPQDRDQRLSATPLMLLHGDETTLCPGPDLQLTPADEVLSD